MIQLHYRSLKAINKPQKPVKTVILITCEGKCTEPGYFKAIKREKHKSNVDIKIVGEHPDPKILVEETKRILRKDGYDFAYCVFDRDSHPSFIVIILSARR